MIPLSISTDATPFALYGMEGAMKTTNVFIRFEEISALFDFCFSPFASYCTALLTLGRL
jgi:hypothetical protein